MLRLDDLVDRNCAYCNKNCIDYQTWLKVQNCLHKVVRDPLFELFIMACIICNTIVLAIEHHGMSQNVRNILDVGNKVRQDIFWNKNSIWTILKRIIFEHFHCKCCDYLYLLDYNNFFFFMWAKLWTRFRYNN